MCGIAGILNLTTDAAVSEGSLRQMLGLLRHRGPDEFGVVLDEGLGLGSARLSIIDLGGGQQPISNEEGTLWIVFNGEIFNYRELRPELEGRGHRFRTDTDTEVLLHLFEEFGPECLSRLNGQFALAIWDTRQRALFLARDRLGIRPLYYTRAGGALIFGSEIKAILGSGRVSTAIDRVALDQVFTYWTTVSPRTAFEGVVELPPGHWLRVQGSHLQVRRYWQMPFLEQEAAVSAGRESTVGAKAEELEELLRDAVRLRLRADVPVAAYLSGGLDSSVISRLAVDLAPSQLRTFSIAFTDPEFDESEFQQRVARHLGTGHEVVGAAYADIARVFPQVIWHGESPILRTSPAPMFMLSGHLKRRGFKVALTGEGADELLGGYDIFKETKIRRYWAASGGERRARLLQRLYPEIRGFGQMPLEYQKSFFGQGLTETGDAFYSHRLRWGNGARLRRFYSREMLAAVGAAPRDPGVELQLPSEYAGWGPLEQAQHLELTLFLANYLLSSQGDRMGMAHGVEGRYPFLDYRVAEFCARLPAHWKLRGLREKYLLRKAAARLLPPEITGRRKRPYRAPIHRAFFHPPGEAYVEELLSGPGLKAAGYFDPEAVRRLANKLGAGARAGETDDMALAGILSTQLLHQQFIAAFRMTPSLAEADRVKICYTGKRRANAIRALRPMADLRT